MFLHLTVILYTGGGCLPLGPGGVHPLGRHLPPLGKHPPGHTPHPHPETATAADGTHPTGMHSCITVCKSIDKLLFRS